MTFEVGRTYTCRSIGDYDCVFSFEVVKRSPKRVWLRYHGRVTARAIRIREGIECCSPLGQYSMSPTLHADKVAA
jgi:hypothetical protein